MADQLPVKRSTGREIDAFLTQAARTPTLAQAKGRLVFAIDATLSRSPAWTSACRSVPAEAGAGPWQFCPGGRDGGNRDGHGGVAR